MKCPFCEHNEDKVVDSRMGKDGDSIRRRRECLKCQSRFTTYERIEMFPVVIKKDGRREHFDRQKILSGLTKACEKRPISVETIELLVKKIEKTFQESGEKEIQSRLIGEQVMEGLKAIDEVAYVRFASVYRQFKDANSFMEELKKLLNDRELSH